LGFRFTPFGSGGGSIKEVLEPKMLKAIRNLIVLTTILPAACSKSPMEAILDGANAAATKLMAPLVQKDASHQVEGLIRTIDDRPACRDFIERLRDAGRGSPYEGATEMTIAHTYDAAGKADCVKSN
jgi:hypothetical protein